MEQQCEYEKEGQYEAQILDEKIFVNSLQAVFTFKVDQEPTKRVQKDCKLTDAWGMLGGDIITIDSRTFKNSSLPPLNRTILKKQPADKDFDPTNHKLQFLHDKLQQEIKTNFAKAIKQRCELTNEFLSYITSIADVDSAVAARLLL